MAIKKKSPATREFRVYATDVLYQDVEATSAEEALRIADEDPCFESCGSGLQLDHAVKDLNTDEFIRVGDAASHCKTCGSEIVVTMNDSNFNEGECGSCEYQRYTSQPSLLELAQAFLLECSDQIRLYRDDLKEDFGDPDDLQEMVDCWKQRRDQCNAAITKAHGKTA